MDGYGSSTKVYMGNKERGLCFVQKSSSGCWELVCQDQSGEAHTEGVMVGIFCEPPDWEEELNEAFFEQVGKNPLSQLQQGKF